MHTDETIYYISENDEFSSTMEAYNLFFNQGINWTTFSLDEYRQGKASSIIVIHNNEPEKLSVINLIRQIRTTPEFSSCPILLVTPKLHDDALKILDSYDFIWTYNTPFVSGDFFDQIRIITNYRDNNCNVLQLYSSIKKSISLKNTNDAIADFNLLKEKYTHDYQINLMHAEIKTLEKQFNEAIEYAEKAKDIFPYSIEINSLLAKLYMHKNDKINLEKTIEDSLNITEVQLANYLYWGNYYLINGETNKAKGSYETALSIEPESEKARHGIVATNILSGKEDLSDGLNGIDIGIFDIARICNIKGITMVNNKQYQTAQTLYLNAVKFLPGKSQSVHKLYYNLGLCLKKAGNLVGAHEYFTTCYKISKSQNLDAKKQMTYIESLLGNVAKASKNLPQTKLDYTRDKKKPIEKKLAS